MNLSRPHSVTIMHWKCLVLTDVMGHVELDAPQAPPGSAASPSPPSPHKPLCSPSSSPLPRAVIIRRGSQAYGSSLWLLLPGN